MNPSSQLDYDSEHDRDEVSVICNPRAMYNYTLPSLLSSILVTRQLTSTAVCM